MLGCAINSQSRMGYVTSALKVTKPDGWEAAWLCHGIVNQRRKDTKLSSFGEIAKHVMQNAAVAHVFEFVERIDAAEDGNVLDGSVG